MLSNPYLQALAMAALAVAAMMIFAWLLSIWRRDAGIVDIFWGLGFVLVSGVYFCLGNPEDGTTGPPRRFLLLVLVTIWGCRLAAHIFWRSRGHGEDYRYAAMRRGTGESFWWRSLYRVFLLQGALILVISLPLMWVFLTPQSDAWHWADGLAGLLWLVGFFFEAVGDWQLTRFKADPSHQGKVMDRGLWSLTRHPNYFGDFVVWWGYFVFTLAVSGGWWTVLGTLLMSFFLMKVSGVALLEKTIVKRRPGYAEYIESTPAFFPRWPSS